MASNATASDPLIFDLTATEMDTTVGMALVHNEINNAIKAGGKIRLRMSETNASTTAHTVGVEFVGGL